MAYTFSVNNSPSTGAVAMYSLISTLMSAGWLKKMDSDGTTYSATGVQVTTGASGAGGLGNANAWVRIQAPAVNQGSVVNQTRELTIQRGADNRGWRVKYSASALFTGGAPAATVTPSSADEVFMLGGGTDAVPTFNTTWFNTDNTYRWHIACGGASEFYSFVAFALTCGTLTAINAIALDAMTAGSFSSTLDVDPAVMYCSSQGVSGISEIVSNTLPSTNVTAPALARAWLGATSAAGAATTGTNNQNVRMLVWGAPSLGSTATFGTNPWTNKDDLLPLFYGRLAGTAPNGIKGFSTLFMAGSVLRNNMTTCDTVSVGSKNKIFFGNVWLPWNGSTPLI